MRVLAAIASVCALASCSFQAALSSGGDATNGDGDTSNDASDANTMRPSCIDRWMAGPQFAAAIPVPGVNSAGSESDPFVTADELAIYFTSGSDIRVATRTAITSSFAAPTIETSLSSADSDYKVSLTADKLTAFVSTRSGGAETRIRRGVRGTPSGAFALDNLYVTAVNDGRDQWDPHISGDGLRLYIAPGNGTAQHPAVATRTSLTTSFGALQTISELASTTKDNDHTFTLDERVVVFSSDRSGDRRLWYAVRANAGDSFGTPVLLSVFPIGDDGAHLSANGCRLYFVSDRNGNNDIFVSELL